MTFILDILAYLGSLALHSSAVLALVLLRLVGREAIRLCPAKWDNGILLLPGVAVLQAVAAFGVIELVGEIVGGPLQQFPAAAVGASMVAAFFAFDVVLAGRRKPR